MMNYEKEYKKLKADIEKAYLFAQSDSTKAVLEHILPELAESEDEKTRKEIISYLQLPHPQFVGERKQEKWIAWLEKQGQRRQINVTDKELAQARKEAYNDALDKIEYNNGEPTFDDGWSAAIWYLKKRNAIPIWKQV